MPATEAQIAANRKNAAKSTGPKTEEGKARSRQNSLKHGLTGEGVVLMAADAAEVARRTAQFTEEMAVIGEIGETIVRRAALHAVRMDRAADQQTTALTARLRQVEVDFVAPDDADEAEAAQLRAEAVRIAMIDTSREGTLARQYEAAAEDFAPKRPFIGSVLSQRAGFWVTWIKSMFDLKTPKTDISNVKPFQEMVCDLGNHVMAGTQHRNS